VVGGPPPPGGLDHYDVPTGLQPGCAAFVQDLKDGLHAMAQPPVAAKLAASGVLVAPTPLAQLNLLGDAVATSAYHLMVLTGKYTPRSMKHNRLALRALAEPYFTALHATTLSGAGHARAAQEYAGSLMASLFLRGFEIYDPVTAGMRM
jgi:hypothetical protein